MLWALLWALLCCGDQRYLIRIAAIINIIINIIIIIIIMP